MAQVLMPKSTAVWLVENTALTFAQIAEFCGMHPLEIKGIADGEVAEGIIGLNPVSNGQLSKEEISRCEEDPATTLKRISSNMPDPLTRSKGPRYTPVAKRQDKPDAIAWLLRNHPELSEGQIIRLIGTTKTTILSIRQRSHWNYNNLKPRDPVLLGLCSQTDLNAAISASRQQQGLSTIAKENIANQDPDQSKS